MFTHNDISQIESREMNPSLVGAQVDRFKTGFAPVPILKAATLGNGILRLTDQELEGFTNRYDEASCRVVKFVPASGAASRMFKPLYNFMDEGKEASIAGNEVLEHFFASIQSFAFFEELSKRYSESTDSTIKEALQNGDHASVLSFLLDEEGLNYGSLPKGLLSFHVYESNVRTPVEEHVAEGLAYACKNDQILLHFTVSPEHEEAFQLHTDEVLHSSESDVSIKASFSFQKPSTDTVAVNLDFTPFRKDDGKLLFRPAGHGALLENLNDIDADLIFIKNIDNVVPDRLKAETITYKKVLAGVLLSFQKRAFDLLKRLDAGEELFEEAESLLNQMGTSGKIASDSIHDLLNRPIRVCGMVKNEGEPGGGPFWVRDGELETLQIVESAQVDQKDKNKMGIFQSSTHFNPVDLVCGVRNYQGEKFNLMKFLDKDAGFIAEKTAHGKKLLAMELPGLWNGSMAYWNTIFVEVPLITFNPVKTVNDLLKPNHR